MHTKLSLAHHKEGQFVPSLDRIHLHIYTQELFCSSEVINNLMNYKTALI